MTNLSPAVRRLRSIWRFVKWISPKRVTSPLAATISGVVSQEAGRVEPSRRKPLARTVRSVPSYSNIREAFTSFCRYSSAAVTTEAGVLPLPKK